MSPPKFHGLPKIHKLDTPLRPIVSSCGLVTYGVAKELAKILKPLVGKSPYHFKSTKGFVEQVRHITLAPGECLSAYDVSALFTSVPIDPALKVIMGLLEKDQTLKDMTLWVSMTLSSYWNFVSRTTILPSKTSSLNRSRVQPWVLRTPSSGAGLWMTPLSSIRKSTNRTFYNTLTVFTLLLGSQWRTRKRMGPSPSWTPLLNQRLMVAYPSLCTGNLLIQTSTYSGIATTTSLPNLVSLTPSPTGPKQCAAILS